MVNKQEFEQLIEQDANIRERMFQYHWQNLPPFQSLDEYTARLQFEAYLSQDARGRLRPERTVLINTYLPIYNAELGNNQNEQQLQKTNSVISSSFRKATTIGLTGLAALIGAQSLDEGSSKDLVELLGATSVVASVFGYAAMYLKNKLSK